MQRITLLLRVFFFRLPDALRLPKSFLHHLHRESIIPRIQHPE